MQIQEVSRYKYKRSAGTNTRGQKVQILRSEGTNTRVSRYKYKGSAVIHTRGQKV